MQWAVALSVLSLLLCLDEGSPRAHHSKSKNPPSIRRQPHIIFILIDDQGFNDIGYHNPTIKTPTLDKLAAEGVRLENYYVQPICTPSRSQLLTGRYQIHTGLQHSIIRPCQPSCLPSHLDTLPQRLRQAGYSTHLVGKWHLGFYRKACLPTRKGFDTFFGSLTGSVDYYSYDSCDGPGLCGYDLHENESVAWGHEGKYCTALFTQKARKILESHDPNTRPLFLMLSLQAVHTPLLSPKSYIYPYRDMTDVARRKFAAMVSTVDEAVRNVTYALRKYGYYKNSVLIYSTDNGAQPFTGGSNWPLRGYKGTYWEGGLRGVAFVHSPLLKRRRRVSTDLLHITDWFPTLVGLAGADIHQSEGLDGFDMWPTLSEGRESPRQEILHNIDPLHKPYAPSASWDVGSGEASVKPLKRATFKKPQKKKVPRLKLKQKSVFKLKNKKKRTHPKHLPKTKTMARPKVKVRPKNKKRKRNSLTEKPTSKSQLKKKKKSSKSTAGTKKVKLKSKFERVLSQLYNGALPTSQPSPESVGPESTGPESSGPESRPGPESACPESAGQESRPGPESAGPESAGQESRPGPESAGPESAGPESAGPESRPSPESAGQESRPGPESAGQESVGPDVTESRPSPESVGPESTGPESAGQESRPGPESAGSESAGPKSVGPESRPGPESAGPESVGPESAGPESVDPESAGPESEWDMTVQAAIRVGDWKLLTGDPGHGDWVPPQVVPSLPGRWWNLERSISFSHKSPKHKHIWLFNISADPFERMDLSDRRPDVVQTLLARLIHYNRTSVPVFFPPDDPRADPGRHQGAWVPWVEEDNDDAHLRFSGVYKKGKSQSKKKKRKKGKCYLCKLESFFQKLNTGMMSNRI